MPGTARPTPEPAARRPATLLLAAWAALAPLTAQEDQSAPGSDDAPRPNVLLILADDLGFSDLGCYGGEIDTPNLDRLAAGGARFSAFYNSARCCPSRASLLTGLHPHEAGIGSFTRRTPRAGSGPAYSGRLLPSCVSMASLLRDHGYSTWMVGKWHLGLPGPIEQGFDDYFGYADLFAYATDQWTPSGYQRLPEGTAPEFAAGGGGREDGSFYATDVFSDYALEFLSRARQEERPWFLYLAHSSPHFPIQAPAETIDKYVARYRRGWDALRAERLERTKRLGLVPADTPLPPRSMVPVDDEEIANGYPGQPNPAWDDLPAARREDLARRMATYAAMVEHVDRGVGRIVRDLEEHGELENTLVLFTSDNGACYEWGPFGFDGPSRRGTTTLHEGEDLRRIGQPGTHQSYGSAWADLCNTPLSMYKHFCHEGGITSPLIVHWPRGVRPREDFVDDPAHIMDIAPTVLGAAGVRYPEESRGRATTPLSGTSLVGACNGVPLPTRPLAFEHQGARGLRLGRYKVVWGKREPDPVTWRLFDLGADRCEQRDLAASMPGKTSELVTLWEEWARRVGAAPFDRPARPDAPTHPRHPTPQVAGREVRIECDVATTDGAVDGVVVAHGGRQLGYALHLEGGRLVFDVRIGGALTRLATRGTVPQRFRATATLDAEWMVLRVGGEEVARGPSPGLIPEQPQDGLNVGRDTRTAAGGYDAPHAFHGVIHRIEVTAGTPPAPPRRRSPTPAG